MSCKDGENKSDPLIDSIRDGLLELYDSSKKFMAETRDENGYEYPTKKEKITGHDFEMILCGMEGSYGEVIDIDAHFQSIGDNGKSFTIRLSDDQFKKLKDLKFGSIVKVKLL